MKSHRSPAASRPLTNAFFAGCALAALAACTDTGGPSPVAQSSIRFVHAGAPVDLTPDGNTALLEDRYTGSGNLFTFDVTTGLTSKKANVGDIGFDWSTGISSNGRISAVYGVPNVVAGIWTEGSGWLNIGSSFASGCDIDIGGSYDISADGHTLVGIMWDGCNATAFKWSDASGHGTFLPMAVLGTPWPGSTAAPSNRATKISDDGQVTGGYAQTDLVDRWPAVWRADGTGFMLTGFPPDNPGEILAINSDGSVVAGNWAGEGFYWTQAGGTVDIGRLPNAMPDDPVYPRAISAGGQLIFGTCGSWFSSTPPAAMVWTQGGGMQSLETIVLAAGIQLPSGYHLTQATAASTDGTVVLGEATDAKGNATSFVLRLPVSAYGL